MPNCIQKTVSGSLICCICGSLLIQVAGSWFCTDVYCIKHADIPAEEQQGFVRLANNEFTVGTASLSSSSIYSVGIIKEEGEI